MDHCQTSSPLGRCEGQRRSAHARWREAQGGCQVRCSTAVLQYHICYCLLSRVKVRALWANGNGRTPTPFPAHRIRPNERQAMIQSTTDLKLQRRDSKREDASDVSDRSMLQGWLLTLATRADGKVAPPKYRSARLRAGRGRGRMLLDRRFSCTLRAASFDDDDEAKDRARRVEERFRYDDDDGLSIGQDGTDDHDRRLIDEHQSRYGASVR